jgi:hypothetical protein
MMEITRKNYTKNREKFILDKCRKKKVLHLGCCDSPYTRTKFNDKRSLFQMIDNVCKEQLGLDIDQPEIEYLHSIGYKNISFFDLNKPGKIDFIADVVIFSDTLEHLMNLEVALSSVKGLMDDSTELVVTVPNATMLSRFVGNFIGTIKEHNDHKVSFTYSSLRQLLEFNGINVNEIFLAGELNIVNSYSNKSLSYKIVRGIYNTLYKGVVYFFPLFSECLIVVCRLRLNKD